MKVKFIAAVLLLALVFCLQPPVIAHSQVESQMGGGYTCGTIGWMDVNSSLSIVAFYPYPGSGEGWGFNYIDGVQVYSTGGVLDPYSLLGQSIRVWMPDFDPSSGYVNAIASYQVVPSCEPVVEFSADQTSLPPGSCTTLRWYVDNVSNLDGVYLDGEYVDPGEGSRTICPGSDTTYFLRVKAGWGEVSTRVDVRLQQPTRTSLPPTRTSPPPTRTALPFVPPTATNTPFQSIQVAPPAGSNSASELSVSPINQHLSPVVTLSNGLTDNGDFDCFLATVSMALGYYRDQGVLGANEMPGYRAIVPMVRGTTPQTEPLTNDPAFVAGLTGNRVTAQANWTEPGRLVEAIQAELAAGDPVVAGVPNGGRLAANWQGMLGHSILVYGVHDGNVFYIDPWDGNRYSLTAAEFAAADTFPSGSSFLITFEPAP